MSKAQETIIDMAGNVFVAPPPPRRPHAASQKPRQSVLERVLLSDGPVFYSVQTCPALFREARVLLDPTPLKTRFEWFFLCLDDGTARRSVVEVRGGACADPASGKFQRTIVEGTEFFSATTRPLKFVPLWDEIRAVGGIEVTVRDNGKMALPDGLLTAVAFNYVKPVLGEKP